MIKNYLLTIIICSITVTASSQTLFTYGPHKADAKEFLKAFNKNNQQPAATKAKAMQDYLDLYINSRLKIQQAYDRGYDTLPQITSEVENLRNQVIENYMSDPEAINKLSKEAFQRSLKDIHAAHIFISFTTPTGTTDTLTARKKLNEAVSRLAKGEDFLLVAQQLSDDPSAKTNKGNLDYITVFTLPYEFENILYTTAAGKYAKPYTSKAGYHIFKNMGERKALGKIKIQQILLALPPDADEATKRSTAKLADSIYQQIIKRGDFAKLAAMYSNDVISANADGNVPDISVGQYDPSFENIIWSLPKDGAVSKPFATNHGYHIVKRVALKPVVTDAANKENIDNLKQRIMQDDRWKTAKDFIYTLVKRKAGFKKPYSDAAIWGITDSLLDNKLAGAGKGLANSSNVFTIGNTNYSVAQWVNYAQYNRLKPDRSGIRPYTEVMDEFSKNSMYQYYRLHLEDFNEDFRSQMAEFKDGNLFFEIMQQEIWNKAQSDSAALLKLYEKNKAAYNWAASADAIVFFCSDQSTAQALHEKIKKNAAEWKKEVALVAEKVVADSSRYEWAQLPGLHKTVPKVGMTTPVSINTTDNTASFTYIVTVHSQPSPRSFAEAKILVINDYQTVLEDEWIKALKKKYPVTIDEKVWKSIAK